MADIDGDGSLDLFVVGQVIHGRYPEASSSLVFRGRPAGKLELDPENTKALARVGLVSGAVFSDLDGDGDADLILACEWGPLKIFRNDAGKLTPWNPQVTFASNAPARTRFETMSQMTGWWNGVTTGDLMAMGGWTLPPRTGGGTRAASRFIREAYDCVTVNFFAMASFRTSKVTRNRNPGGCCPCSHFISWVPSCRRCANVSARSRITHG